MCPSSLETHAHQDWEETSRFFFFLPPSLILQALFSLVNKLSYLVTLDT